MSYKLIQLITYLGIDFSNIYISIYLIICILNVFYEQVLKMQAVKYDLYRWDNFARCTYTTNIIICNDIYSTFF